MFASSRFPNDFTHYSILSKPGGAHRGAGRFQGSVCSSFRILTISIQKNIKVKVNIS